MAVGDVWLVNNSYVLVRPNPGTGAGNSSVGNLYKGTFVVEKERKELVVSGKTQIWVRCNSGWVMATSGSERYMNWVHSAANVKEVNTNSSIPSEEELASIEGFGYQPDTTDILAFTNDDISESEFINIQNVTGVFGLPYQFLPNTDPRLTGSNDTAEIGYEYAERIIEKIPLLFMSPGKASFMTKYSSKNRKNILEKLITLDVVDDNLVSMEDLLDSDGRYYTFEYDTVRYYKFVNPMCRIAARYLNLQNVVVNGQKLDTMNWETQNKSGISSIGDFGTYSAIPFYLDTDTSIGEGFSNSTTDSMLASSVNSVSDMGRELNFLLGYTAATTGADLINTSPEMRDNVKNMEDAISSLVGTKSFLSNLGAHLTTVAAGGKLIFPEIWADSSFTHSHNIRIKLISPDPSTLSVYLNVLVPLFHLIGLTAPQSVFTNPNGYTNPFLVRAIYKGFFNIDMGIITDLDVTKGAECQWTIEGIPTSIEVSMTIKDLYKAMSITSTDSSQWKYDTLNNTALMDYIANLCGINIYKPEIARMIELWWVNNIENRITDIFQVDIWERVQQKVQNTIMNTIYRR